MGARLSVGQTTSSSRAGGLHDDLLDQLRNGLPLQEVDVPPLVPLPPPALLEGEAVAEVPHPRR